MIRPASIVAIVAAAVSVSAQAKDKEPHIYGPAPSWEAFRQIAEAGLAAKLVDPESARITWIDGYHKGEFKPFLAPRMAGYIACGQVNARNRMGGYVGAQTFVVIVDYDRVLYADISTSPAGMITEQCNAARRAGLFPPLTASAKAASTTSAPGDTVGTTSSGLSLRAMPDGAYITAVTAGSPASTAGLKPGMVISSINAIPLAGMGDAMLKVVGAASADATLTIIGGPTLKLAAEKR